MTARLLLVLLAVSMVFNVAVVVGFMRTRATTQNLWAPQPESRPSAGTAEARPWLDRVARDLKLNSEQRRSFAALQERHRQQQAVFNDSVIVLRQDLQDEVRKAEPDVGRIRALVDQEADLVRQRRLGEANLYGEFMSLLEEDQRARLGQRLTKPIDQRPGSASGRPDGRERAPAGLSADLVRKFDRNRNGRLEGEEARDARRELQSRRRELMPRIAQLPPLWPWFDRNGDGELDEAEQSALANFLQEHRPADAEFIRPEQLMPPAPREGRPDARRRSAAESQPRSRSHTAESRPSTD